MGYGQFMPSSYKEYAVDFNGDGHINLWGSGRYRQCGELLQARMVAKGDTVAVPANGQAPGLANGFKTKYSLFSLPPQA